MILATTQLSMTACGDAQASMAQSADQPTMKPEANTSFGPLKQIHAGVLNIGYAEAGPANGPVVILLHGWPYDIHSYVDVAPLLAKAGYRVIVPYLPARLWHDALSCKRNVPQCPAVGSRSGYHRVDGCAQNREGDPRWL